MHKTRTERLVSKRNYVSDITTSTVIPRRKNLNKLLAGAPLQVIRQGGATARGRVRDGGTRDVSPVGHAHPAFAERRTWGRSERAQKRRPNFGPLHRDSGDSGVELFNPPGDTAATVQHGRNDSRDRTATDVFDVRHTHRQTDERTVRSDTRHVRFTRRSRSQQVGEVYYFGSVFFLVERTVFIFDEEHVGVLSEHQLESGHAAGAQRDAGTGLQWTSRLVTRSLFGIKSVHLSHMLRWSCLQYSNSPISNWIV